VINTSLQRFSTTSNEAVMSITNFLGSVKDYRKPQGKRYSLPSVLRLVLAGLLCGTNNLATIHRWAKTLGKKALIDLDFYKGIINSGDYFYANILNYSANVIFKTVKQELFGTCDLYLYLSSSGLFKLLEYVILRPSNCCAIRKVN
jgi:hypothetical protein